LADKIPPPPPPPGGGVIDRGLLGLESVGEALGSGISGGGGEGA